MNRDDIIVIVLLFIGFPLLVKLFDGGPTQPKPVTSYSAPAPQAYTPRDGGGALSVLTKPRYQDVPALNRPMMLPACAYRDTGCSE